MSFSRTFNKYDAVNSWVIYPLTLLFQKTKVVIWLYDNIEMRIEGRIIVRAPSSHRLQPLINTFQGFDEFMNLIIDDAAEVFVKESKPRRELGASILTISRSSRSNAIFGFQVVFSSKETTLLSFSRSRNAEGSLV
jgi:small nuclear ribonucleoprotein E